MQAGKRTTITWDLLNTLNQETTCNKCRRTFETINFLKYIRKHDTFNLLKTCHKCRSSSDNYMTNIMETEIIRAINNPDIDLDVEYIKNYKPKKYIQTESESESDYDPCDACDFQETMDFCWGY